MEVERLWNMVLIWVPRAVMAAMHTTAIRASSRPYSASVAPSSWRVTNLAKNLRAAVRCFIERVSSVLKGATHGLWAHNLGSNPPRGCWLAAAAVVARDRGKHGACHPRRQRGGKKAGTG